MAKLFFKKLLIFHKVYDTISTTVRMPRCIQWYNFRTVLCALCTNVRSIKEGHKMEKIQAFVNEQLKTEVPQFNIGDSVKVYIRISEGEKTELRCSTVPLSLSMAAASLRPSL